MKGFVLRVYLIQYVYRMCMEKEKMFMSSHYSDYQKKAVSVDSLTFGEISESDKELLKKVRGASVKSHLGFIILIGLIFAVCAFLLLNSIIAPISNIYAEIASFPLFIGGMFLSGRILYNYLGGCKGLCKGVVINADRLKEFSEKRNATFQYVFDIYLEDKDQTLMSYSVLPEVFEAVGPGDGVLVVKVGRKIQVLEDPDRKGVMDVSNIKSGI